MQCDLLFVAIVPVKPPGQGKTRLGDVPPAVRGQLAVAFATDALRACLAAQRVGQVLVVTEDSGFAEHAAALGAVTCGDGEERGLNPALRHGARVAAARWPTLRPFALCGDLPSLLPDELDAALGAVAEGPSYVADAAGTGTSLYSAPYDAFDPRYGVDSARAHSDAGAAAIPGELRGLRRDVDDMDDLRAAVALGVGHATNALLPVLADLRSSAGT